MIRLKLFGLGALVIALSACGANQQAAAPAGGAAPEAMAATPAAPAAAPTAAAMAGMDHSATPGTAMGASAAPYDALFIDSMMMHHQGAITMATQALAAAEHPELKQLAQDIIKAQQGELTQMQGWRKAWYPNVAPTKGMGMDMGTMMVADDPAKPFDQRFMEAMIPHHQGATSMAKDALQKAEHPEIKTLAQNIIASQDAEIAQMQQWQQSWFKK